MISWSVPAIRGEWLEALFPAVHTSKTELVARVRRDRRVESYPLDAGRDGELVVGHGPGARGLEDLGSCVLP